VPLREAASHELVEAAGMHPSEREPRRRDAAPPGSRAHRPRQPPRKLLQLTPEGVAVYCSILPHVQANAARLFDTMSREEIVS
jgi:hypothetical protein